MSSQLLGRLMEILSLYIPPDVAETVLAEKLVDAGFESDEEHTATTMLQLRDELTDVVLNVGGLDYAKLFTVKFNQDVMSKVSRGGIRTGRLPSPSRPHS